MGKKVTTYDQRTYLHRVSKPFVSFLRNTQAFQNCKYFDIELSACCLLNFTCIFPFIPASVLK